MKITPVAGTGVPGQAISTGPDLSRIERAKAVFAGQELPQQEVMEQQEAEQPNIKTIKVKTNFSTNRDDQQTQQVVEEPKTTTSQMDMADTTEQVNGTDETMPIDPQVARLMKIKRGLQVKERELAQKEEALSKQTQINPDEYVSKADLKANALGILQREDLLGPKTYDVLTEQILANQNGVTPEINSLKAEIKALREEVSGQLDTRDKQAESQVLAQMNREAVDLTREGEQYEAIRAANAQKDIVKLVHRVWQKGWAEKGLEPGHLLDMAEAADIIENQLIQEAVPFAKLKKVQSRLTPAQVEQQAEKLATQRPNTKVMRTLTNRDTATPTMDRRARAIAAMQGTLKKG